MEPKPRRALPAALIICLLAGLTACAPTVALDPAPDATSEGCAEVIARLPRSPAEVASLPARETDAQGTGAWGSPVGVILRCGVAPPGPSTLPCYTVNSVDWLEDSSGAPNYVFTTYGRVPAVEVIVDSKLASGTAALNDLANAVGTIKPTKKCIGAEDVLPGEGEVPGESTSPAPAPSPSGR